MISSAPERLFHQTDPVQNEIVVCTVGMLETRRVFHISTVLPLAVVLDLHPLGLKQMKSEGLRLIAGDQLTRFCILISDTA
jgi:hypothetical protein